MCAAANRTYGQLESLKNKIKILLPEIKVVFESNQPVIPVCSTVIVSEIDSVRLYSPDVMLTV